MHRGTPAFLTVAAASILAMALEPARAVADSPAASVPDAYAKWCIAGVCLAAPEKQILERFGDGRAFPEEAPYERCYQARGKSYYVTVFLADEDPARRVTGILLGSEMTCPAAAPARFAPDRAGCRDLKPFDSADKLANVGATEREWRDKGYPWDGSPYEVHQFDYRCEPDDECSIMASAFVRGRTIIAVSIWEPDC